MLKVVTIRYSRYEISPWSGFLSAILPGLGHFFSGKISRGTTLIILYLIFVIFTIESWPKISGIIRSNRIDEWVAAVFLFLVLFGLWLYAVLNSTFQRISETESGHSQWSIAWRQFNKNNLAMIGLVCVIGFYFVAVLAPFLATNNPNEFENALETRYLPPSFDHPFGTDKFGRDIYSRMIYGARVSLSVGFVAVFISIILGTFIGSIAGYFSGKIDGFLMRFVDMLLAFPRLFLILALIALYSNSIWLTMAVLGLTGWMGTSRMVRGEILSIKEEEYILAARALGMSDGRIVFRHLIPNILAPLIVIATLGIGNTILAESFLSYLGLSVQPPTPTWGSIIFEGQDNLLGAWWISTFPGVAIVLTVLGYNLVGDGLRDALDPKLRDGG